MIKSRRSGGATLLEVMLVLAVAAMVIVMSIKYYKNAQNSQYANSLMSQVNSIITAADQVAQGNSGSYATVSTTTVMAVLGLTGTSMTSPFGSNITVGSASSTGYTVTINSVPSAICTVIKPMMATNSKLAPGTCAAAGASSNLAIVFTSTN